MAITRRQREVYDFISRFVAEHGYSPSFEEIGKRPSSELAGHGAQAHHQSGEKGTANPRLQPQPSIDLIPPKGRLKQSMSVNTGVVLPLVGRIAAGQPIEAVENPETISLADFVRSKEVFVLEVRGDSMQDEAILDGDYVLVEKAEDSPQWRHRGRAGGFERRHAEALLPRRRQHPTATLERDHEADHRARSIGGSSGASDRGAEEVLANRSFEGRSQTPGIAPGRCYSKVVPGN